MKVMRLRYSGVVERINDTRGSEENIHGQIHEKREKRKTSEDVEEDLKYLGNKKMENTFVW